MRTTSKRRKATAGPVPQKIRIEFHAEHAQQVRLASPFNDWRRDATPMLALGEGS
jgi:hypothetical protein